MGWDSRLRGWRLAAAVCAVLIPMLAAAGCGGDEGAETVVETVTEGATTDAAPDDDDAGAETAPTEEVNTEEEAVEETMNDYYEAFVAMDYEEVCALLAPRILGVLAAQSDQPGNEACVDRFGRFNRGPSLRDAAGFEVKAVNVDGNRAVASFKTEDERNAVKLVKVDGEWRIEESPE